MSAPAEIAIDANLHYEISQFLFAEAALIDAHDFSAWLELTTEDITYRIPVRITKEKRDGPNVDALGSFVLEDAESLGTRIARLGTRSAWSDDPQSRTRHFISNVAISPADRPDELAVRSNLLFIRSRGEQIGNDVITAQRQDLIRRVGDQWKLARREVVIDQTILGTHNLNTIY